MFLQHNESASKSIWKPRHPFVAYHDLFVLAFAVSIAMLTDSFMRIYFVVMAAMFMTSALHHWLTQASWHYRLDRATVQFLIAGTPLPYTEYLVQSGNGHWYFFLWSVAIFGAFATLSGRLMYKGFWPSIAYVVPGLLAVWCMYPVTAFFPPMWAVLFWAGVGCYALQLLSYNRGWFDWFPGRFGYREVQHLILLVAILLHTSAIMYL